MCGIIGGLRIGDSKNANNFDDFLAEALLFDQVRGKDSTGLAVLKKEWVGGTPELRGQFAKEASDGTSFIRSSKFSSLVSTSSNIAAAIGHNRAATIGKVSDENAHPFREDNIILVQNGTIRNAGDLVERSDKWDVDTEAVTIALSRDDITVVAPKIEKLGGAYSLVWFDLDDNSINFIRNKERPMWFVDNADGFLFFGSEPLLVAAAMARNGFVPGAFHELEPHVHVKFQLSTVIGGFGKPRITTRKIEMSKTTHYVKEEKKKDDHSKKEHTQNQSRISNTNREHYSDVAITRGTVSTTFSNAMEELYGTEFAVAMIDYIEENNVLPRQAFYQLLNATEWNGICEHMKWPDAMHMEVSQQEKARRAKAVQVMGDKKKEETKSAYTPAVYKENLPDHNAAHITNLPATATKPSWNAGDVVTFCLMDNRRELVGGQEIQRIEGQFPTESLSRHKITGYVGDDVVQAAYDSKVMLHGIVILAAYQSESNSWWIQVRGIKTSNITDPIYLESIGMTGS